ncbi:MAG: hypothetical protein ACOZJX_12555 [Pseudomonadota bacterium]
MNLVAGLALAVAVCISATPALAESAVPRALQDRLRAGHLAYIQSAVKDAKPREGTRGLDPFPPVLTAFSVPYAIDVGESGARLTATFSATDNQAGVARISVSMVGPMFQSIFLQYSSSFPEKQLQHVAHAPDDLSFYAPGEYVVDNVCVRDHADNLSCYNSDALAAFGNLRTVVSNSRAYDMVAPSLVRGKILTPTLNLSKKHRGTREPPLAGVKLEVEDTGSPTVSGVQVAGITFCMNLGEFCFDVYNPWGEPPRTGHAIQNHGGTPGESAPSGTYRIALVTVSDHAGNTRSYLAKDMHGFTDFLDYFPTVEIQVTR